MAVNATRSINSRLTGDVVANNTLEAAANASSPGTIEVRTLANGFNEITKATGATGVTIVPPAANATAITLKGVTGDTGIALHLTDPTSIGLAAGVTTIGLTAGAEIVGVRFYWT